MRPFSDILAIAADRHGGLDAVTARLHFPKPLPDIVATPDDRFLAAFTRGIFQAGFNWKVVEAMWPGFEAAFFGFDLFRCSMLHDDDFAALIANTAIIRHGPKIRAVQQNATFLSQIARDHGSVGAFIAGWPRDDYAGLLTYLKKNGTRLGGNTGQYALRYLGVDGYILSRDVVGRLIAEGVIDAEPGSAKSFAAVQAAFNTWAQESGRSLTEISRVLAMSVG